MTSENNSILINLDEIDPTLPAGHLERQMCAWFGDYAGPYSTVLQVDSSLELPYVCKARELSPGKVYLNQLDNYHRSLPISFPEGVSTALLSGGVLQTDTTTWLRAPTPLGEGGNYIVTWAMDVKTGNQTILRIGKANISAESIALDHRFLVACDHRPEIPKADHLERALGQRGVIVLKPFDKPWGRYSTTEVDRLSVQNLHRIVHLQWYSLRQWIASGVVYTDWQGDEMVRWETGTHDDSDTIEGFREIDFSPNPSIPPEVTLPLVSRTLAKIDRALVDRKAVEELQPVHQKLRALRQELEGLKPDTPIHLPVDHATMEEFARRELKKRWGAFRYWWKEGFQWSDWFKAKSDLIDQIRDRNMASNEKAEAEVQRKLTTAQKPLHDQINTRRSQLFEGLLRMENLDHVDPVEVEKTFEVLERATREESRRELVQELQQGLRIPGMSKLLSLLGLEEERNNKFSTDATRSLTKAAIIFRRLYDMVGEPSDDFTYGRRFDPIASIKTFLRDRVSLLLVKMPESAVNDEIDDEVSILLRSTIGYESLVKEVQVLMKRIDDKFYLRFPQEKRFFVIDTEDDIRVEYL